MTETSSQVYDLPGLAFRTFPNFLFKLNPEHMPAILALNDIHPEMYRSTLNGQRTSLDQKICHFLSCFFDQAGKSGTGNFHFIGSHGMG